MPADQSLTPATGGYIVLSAKGIKTIHVPVSTADQAGAIWARFVDFNGFGASDLKRDSGNIWSNGGQLIGKVSYNGRVWDTDGKLLQDIAGGLPVPNGYRNV